MYNIAHSAKRKCSIVGALVNNTESKNAMLVANENVFYATAGCWSLFIWYIPGALLNPHDGDYTFGQVRRVLFFTDDTLFLLLFYVQVYDAPSQ